MACVNCGSTVLTVGVNRKFSVPVHFCPGCGFYCSFGMSRELVAAMLATRLQYGVSVE